MTDFETSTAPHRATILVGYGDFGLAAQSRLLESAAPRGMLQWEEPRGGAGPNERCLADLALLWVPDRPVGPNGGPARQQNAFEMMRDLHLQIEQVGDGRRNDADFAGKLSSAAKQLLSAEARIGRRGQLPFGLDVIVIAHPTSRDEIGLLDRLLAAGMERVANDTALERAVKGSEALNFIQILDFENYWDQRGTDLRRAVYDSIDQWQAKYAAGTPAFGRFYLVDGNAEGAVRSESDRIDEIVLFLEFMLFEGQRAGDLQRLYQSPLEKPVLTFGIRLMERSAGLLRRLAAARFGIGWLDYLGGNGMSRDADVAVELARQLDLYRPDALDGLLDANSLRTRVDAELVRLERELLGLRVESPDWPQRVREQYNRSLRRLETDISRAAEPLMARVSNDRLVHLGEHLQKAINGDLHRDRDPVSLGRVIDDLQAAVDALDPPADDVAQPDVEPASALSELEVLHERYRQFNLQRVSTDGLKQWWWLFAIVIAAGLTPLLHELLNDVPKPDSMKFLVSQAYRALQWLNNPAALGPGLFLAAWGFGAIALQPRLAGRVDYARRQFNDAERGRFIGLLRRSLAPGGALRVPIDAMVERIIRDMILSVRGEVTRELRRVLERLRARSKEMRWLSDQLRRFLRMYGITGEELRADPGALVRGRNAFRYTVEKGEDLDETLQSNPAEPGRFGSAQSSRKPFTGWSERYSRAFLVPGEFIDDLSHEYRDRFLQELGRPGDGNEQQRIAEGLRTFLQQHGACHLGFRFKGSVPPDDFYCLIPESWSNLPGVMQELRNRRITEDKVLRVKGDTGRTYLLRLRSGIDPQCVVESS